VQRAINREQPFSEVQKLVEYIRARSFRSLNFDLIYGLPLQTVESIKTTLTQVLQLSPDRISYYNYAHLPQRFSAQKAIREEDLPTAEQKLIILTTIIEMLTNADYLYIGMDHFVKRDDPLAIAREEGKLYRNFQGYSVEKASDLIGLGVSSISSVSTIYAQNAVQLDAYYKALDNNQLPIVKGCVLSREDILRRDIIQQLSCYRFLDIDRLERLYQIHFIEHFQSSLGSLRQLEHDGLIEWDGFARLSVTQIGSLLIRNICMVFDEYLSKNIEKADGARGGFSRVI